jgi:hypothetical protein
MGFCLFLKVNQCIDQNHFIFWSNRLLPPAFQCITKWCHKSANRCIINNNGGLDNKYCMKYVTGLRMDYHVVQYRIFIRTTPITEEK